MEIIFIICILLISVSFHEFAHGWAAYCCGDSTAKDAGRLTLNPISHIDPVGTIAMPILFAVLKFLNIPIIPIAWAKPVPVNFGRLKNPKRDMIWVGLAGPMANMILVLIFVLCKKLIGPFNIELNNLLYLGIFVNLLLGVFNLIPIPPLDGSRIVMGILPNKYAIQYAKAERFGFAIVIVLVMSGWLFKIIDPIVKILLSFVYKI